MKKQLSLLLSILIILFAFASCSDNIQDSSFTDVSNSVTEEVIGENNRTEYELDYFDEISFEAALNKGEKVSDKIVQFCVNDYKPDSALGINCWAGEHLNFISEDELDVSKGDTIIGRVTKEPTKVFSSWKIKYKVISIIHKKVDVVTTTTENTTTTEQKTETTTEKLPETTTIITTHEITKPTQPFENELNVHFIDVGQGDAIFIELPNKETMLIDAGQPDGVALNYIKRNGYKKVNYVVATHPDADHIGGIDEVLNSLTVDEFYMPEKEHTTQAFEKMLDAVSENGCDAIYAFAGKYIVDLPNLKIYFVGPTTYYSDNNDMSAVIKLEYKNTSFIFTGDSESNCESDMINEGYNLKADVLKVGHHGSNSSTSQRFLNAVNPKIAVISVGDNSYGHPTQEVLALLNDNYIDIYRTDEVGTVIITSDGVEYSIDKNKSEIQINAPPVVEKESTTEYNNLTESENNSIVVYRTNTGAKYHRSGCSYLKSKIETTVDEAKRMGLTPCSRCNPPS